MADNLVHLSVRYAIWFKISGYMFSCCWMIALRLYLNFDQIIILLGLLISINWIERKSLKM